MADLLQPPDITQFRAFASGDEHALARIYRTQYDALTELAADALGADLAHFSGRVAQQAMLTTWDRRDRYENVIGLTAALEDAIRTEAAIQRRKHQALHHGDHTTRVSADASKASHLSVASADEAVDRLLAELHAAPVDHAVAQEAAQAARKHAAAEHVQQVARGRGWKAPTVIVVIGTIAVLGLMRWLGASSEEVAATQALKADNARTVNSARGQRGGVTLSDGSLAKLGSDSHLKLPNDFGGNVRTLELNGTAMFTVKQGLSRAFVVRAGNAVVTATGTVFTVRAFPEDSAVYIGVDEGSVSVRATVASGTTTVDAGKAMRLGKDGSVQMLDDATRQLALEWVHDTLVFVNAPMSTVLPELQRWFDVNASLADPSLGTRTVSLRIGLQSSGQALAAVAEAAKLQVGFDAKDAVVLSNAAKTPD